MNEQMAALLPDIPRLYTALAEWLACMAYILPQRRRFGRAATGCAAAAALALQAGFLVLTGGVPLAWWVPCMGAAVGLMYLFLYLCGDVTPTAAGYFCARAFILAEFSASLLWQLYCLLPGAVAGVTPLSLAVMLCGCTAIAVLIWWGQRREGTANLQIDGKSFLSAAIMAVLVFAVSNVGFVQSNAEIMTDYGIFYVRTLVDFSGLLILSIQQRQLYETNLHHELDAMDATLNHQYEQYRQSRENIRLLNRRYHDLKVQIAHIRAERDPGKQAEYLAEMETGIRQYEAENKTGNPVLDTVLTTKSLYCAQHGITMTCVADGRLLSFMSAMEICTVFGTAIDAAIEQVRTLPDEQRLIRVAVYAQNGMLMLRFENYFGQAPQQEAAPDDYGKKSICAIAQKYSGSVTEHTEDGWRYLRVLLAPTKTEA